MTRAQRAAHQVVAQERRIAHEQHKAAMLRQLGARPLCSRAPDGLCDWEQVRELEQHRRNDSGLAHGVEHETEQSSQNRDDARARATGGAEGDGLEVVQDAAPPSPSANERGTSAIAVAAILAIAILLVGAFLTLRERDAGHEAPELSAVERVAAP